MKKCDENDWHLSLSEYCDYYDLKKWHLVNALKDSKVIPMVRGLAREMSLLDEINQTGKYLAVKPENNDYDIFVKRIAT